MKHWLLDYGDLSKPPKFKFRLVRSFADTMSRQLSEAVRFELRGSDILNSKAEIVLEDWRRIENGMVLRSINNLDKEVQNRIVEYCVQMRTEEISLMTSLRLE